MRFPRKRWVAVLCTRDPYATAEPRQQFGPHWTRIGAERVANWANHNLIPWELAGKQRFRVWSLDTEQATQNEGKPMGEKATTITRWDVAALILLLASATTGAVAFIADSHTDRVAFGVLAVVALAVWAVSWVKRRGRRG